MKPESSVASLPPTTICLPRPNRFPWTKSSPTDRLLAAQDPVGTGAQGNLSFTAMLIRTPPRKFSHQTFTSANRPAVLRRSRTDPSVSLSSVSPILIPARDRTVSSSVRALPRTCTSVIRSPTARAAPAASHSPVLTNSAARCGRSRRLSIIDALYHLTRPRALGGERAWHRRKRTTGDHVPATFFGSHV